MINISKTLKLLFQKKFKILILQNYIQNLNLKKKGKDEILKREADCTKGKKMHRCHPKPKYMQFVTPLSTFVFGFNNCVALPMTLMQRHKPNFVSPPLLTAPCLLSTLIVESWRLHFLFSSFFLTSVFFPPTGLGFLHRSTTYKFNNIKYDIII